MRHQEFVELPGRIRELTLEQKAVVIRAYFDPVPRKLPGLATPDRVIQIRRVDYPGSLPDRSRRTAWQLLVPTDSYSCSVSWRTESPVGVSSKDKADGASTSATAWPR